MISVKDIEKANRFYVDGNGSLARGDIHGAVWSFEKAIKLNPHQAKFYINKGICLVLTGKIGNAVECYIQSLSIDPEYPQTYLHLGHALYFINNKELAIRSYRLFLDKASHLNQSQDLVAMHLSATSLLENISMGIIARPSNAVETLFIDSISIFNRNEQFDILNLYSRAISSLQQNVNTKPDEKEVLSTLLQLPSPNKEVSIFLYVLLSLAGVFTVALLYSGFATTPLAWWLSLYPGYLVTATAITLGILSIHLYILQQKKVKNNVPPPKPLNIPVWFLVAFILWLLPILAVFGAIDATSNLARWMSMHPTELKTSIMLWSIICVVVIAIINSKLVKLNQSEKSEEGNNSDQQLSLLWVLSCIPSEILIWWQGWHLSILSRLGVVFAIFMTLVFFRRIIQGKQNKPSEEEEDWES